MTTQRFEQTRNLLAPHVIMDRLNLVVDMERSQGSWLVDGATGTTFFDGFTGFASLPLGWNHPALRNKEFEAQLIAAAIDKPALSDLYVPQFAEFVDTFQRIAIPDELPYSFFVSGGALAVENGLKTAFDWKTRLNRSLGNAECGDKIIHFRQAFHGRSGYTMSITDSPDPRKCGDYPQFDWPRIENPYIRFPETEANATTTMDAEQRALGEIEAVLAKYPNRVAGIIIEPIQGEGGDRHFRAEFLQALRRVADEARLLLIFDEVQSGMGVTGDWWAHKYSGIRPDVMCFGKKTQVCGIVASRRLDEVEGHVFATSSRLNSTWGGNLVDMVRSRRILEVIEEQDLLSRVRRVGAGLKQGLFDLADRYPMVSAVRGRGSFLAFDFPDSDTRNAFVNCAQEERLLVLGCGHRTLRLRPHLAFTEDDSATLLERLDASLARLTRSS